MLVSMTTHTSVVDYLKLPIRRFYQIALSVSRILERRNGGGNDNVNV